MRSRPRSPGTPAQPTPPVKLNLGCGVHIASGFINVDKAYTLKQLKSNRGIFKTAIIEPGGTYVQADIRKLPFADNYADYVESIAAFEHISFRVIIEAFKEVRRVMKPGGKFLMVTTNFDNLAKLWCAKVADRNFDNQQTVDDFSNLMEVVYGNQIWTGEYHCIPFNPPFLFWILQQAGFRPDRDVTISIHPMGSSDLNKMITTMGFPPGAVCRTEMIAVEAWKRGKPCSPGTRKLGKPGKPAV